jgi:RHS repeat-associated protein
VTNYTYDSTNTLLTTVANPQGTTQYAYVTGANEAQQYAISTITNTNGTYVYLTYDSQGRLINQQGCLCPTNPVTHLIYGYGVGGVFTTTDNAGGVTTQWVNQFGAATITQDPLGLLTHFYYDANGNLIREVLPNGAVETSTYDTQGNVLTQTDPLGNTISYAYNAANDLASYTDPAGNKTSYTYDSSNDLLSATYANGAQETYTYNPLGEATSFLSRNANTISYVYNANGELTKETFADGTFYQYSYDKFGNLTSATDASSRVTTFTHGGATDGDPNDPNLLSQVSYPDGTFLKFFYNTGAQRIQSVDQTGFTINYSYDDAGRLSKLTDAGSNLIVQYTYDADGNLSQQDNGNGTRTVYTYDADGNALSITHLAPNYTTINSYDDYAYDSVGNILTDTNQDGQWAYTYDAASQLTGAVFTPNATDPDGLASQNLQYAYDTVGNRTSQTINGVTTTYTVNSLNQYVSSATTGLGTTTYAYDADGNLITTTAPGNAVTTYAYSELDDLTGVTGSGQSASYFYDPLGHLVSQTVGGATTNFQIDPVGLGNVVAAFSGAGVYSNSGGLVGHYTYGIGLVSQVNASSTAVYYDFDFTGNTIDINGADGTIIGSYTYLPFGVAGTFTTAIANPFTYGAQSGILSVGNNLYSMRARVYSSTIGRFGSMDPLGLAGGQANVYGYASNNPIRFNDPLGLCISATQKDLDLYVENNNIYALETALNNAIQTNIQALGAVGNATTPAQFATARATQHLATATINRLYDLLSSSYAQLAKTEAEQVCPPPSPPPPPPSPPPAPKPGNAGGGGGASNPKAADPNDIVGVSGYGSGGYIVPSQTLPYIIDFENESNATAPAQVVEVTQQLSSNLNWNTFQLTSFGFGGLTFTIPAGLLAYSTVVDDRTATGVYVDVAANFNVLTGLLTWTFTSIDPTTLDIPLGNVEEGFLPPNAVDPEGEGFVSYQIQPKTSDTSGAQIYAGATVIFDAGESDQSSLNTVTILNTVDDGAPTSSITALPATEPASFTLNWSGHDDSGGSGIATYSIYASDNGGAYSALLTATASTSTTFTGTIGHTYRFYSVATDNVGNVQSTPASAQTTTAVRDLTSFSGLSASSIINYGTASVTFTGVISASDAIPPSTETVAVKLNGVTMNAAINSQGGFSATFNTATLPASIIPYQVTYSYADDGTFGPASDSSTTQVTVVQAAAVANQPTNQTVVVGQMASFTATAIGSPTPTVQWQMSTDSGTTWTDISGATSTTYKVATSSIAQTGNEYRAVFTNSYGTATTNAATLTVTAPAPVTVTSVVINGNLTGFTGAQRSMVDSIVYTFSEKVNLAATGAFTIAVHDGEQGTAPTLIRTAINPDANGASTQWVVTFSGSSVVGNSIANGVYDITLNPSAVTSEANPTAAITPRATDTFYRLYGDYNGDQVVNATDNLHFKNAITTYDPIFDYDNNGAVNATDNLHFKASISFVFNAAFTSTI